MGKIYSYDEYKILMGIHYGCQVSLVENLEIRGNSKWMSGN